MAGIRFGMVADAVATPGELQTLARDAEQAGLSTLLIRDHVVAGPFGDQLGPLVSMTAAALATSRLRIGTMVIANDFRPPVQLAKEIATLDALSNGRVELGLGAGFLAEEYAPLGIPFERPGVRVSRLGEAIRLLKQLLSGVPVTFHGTHYTVDNFVSFPPARQRPHPPIMVAGSGDRMLALAAREADIVGFQTVTTTSGTVTTDPGNYLESTFRHKLGLVRDAAGDRWPRIELQTTVTLQLADDRETAARAIIAARGWTGIEVADVLAMPSMLIGTVAEVVSTVRQRHHDLGLGYFVISQDAFEDGAAVIAALGA